MTAFRKTLSLGWAAMLLASLFLVPFTHAEFGGDPDCGYFTGTTRRYGAGQMLFDYYKSTQRVCIDYSAYVEDGNAAALSYHSSLGQLNWDWGDSADLPYVDLETGYLHGYLRVESLVSSVREGSLPANEMWVWLDWDCSGGSSGILGDSSCRGKGGSSRTPASSYKPQVDLETGALSGFAWSDYLYRTTGNGYIFLRGDGTEVELPPTQVQVVVDVVTPDDTDGDRVYDTDYTVEEADRETAPLADGAQFWRVRIRAYDTLGSTSLTGDDIIVSNVNVVETSDSNIYVDQLMNQYDAIEESLEHSPLGCADDGSNYACELTEWESGCDEGDCDTSFNHFIYSGGPTSNMLYMKAEGVDYTTDRDGCPWIYYDQWAVKRGFTSQPYCSGVITSKDDYFYARDDSRNKYEIDYITFSLTSADGSDIEIYGDSGLTCSPGQCMYEFDGEADLKFSPRFRIESLSAFYDGSAHLQISDEVTKTMSLDVRATMEDRSEEYIAMHGAAAGNPIGYTVGYQLDATTSNGGDWTMSDLRLLMDVDPPHNSTVDKTYYDDSITSGTFTPFYSKSFNMGYGQDRDLCSGVIPCSTPSNTLSDPTAEVWVCDQIGEIPYSNNSCYYVAYLPIRDRQADPEGMAVYGAINSTLDEDDVLDATNSDDVSVLGSVDNFKRRNVLNSYLTRLVLGHENPSGGELGASGVVSGDILELMGGTLYYAEGDVTVSSGFSGTLAVKGGNVFIDADVDGDPGEAGILVFSDDGEGGNVYVGPDVTTIVASLFLDGSFQSYDGDSSNINSDGIMDWDAASTDGDGDAHRLATLEHQLYLVGSLVSRNTVGGSPDDEDCSAGCEKGDGTSTTDYDVARAYDLAQIRQYRLCYPLDSSGNIVEDDTMKEICDDTDTGLSTYGEDAEEYSSFVIEFAAPGDIPVFVLESKRSF